MKVTWNEIVNAAATMKVEPCALMAVIQIESNGDGFLSDGRPKILFEPHVFWRELTRRYYKPCHLLAREDIKEMHGDISDILYKTWKRNGYGKPGKYQWERLNRAIAINEDAALCSASWGLFQIMGFNYKLCGYPSVHEFIRDMECGYAGQFRALEGFLKGAKILKALREKNWPKFARLYNGSGYEKNSYDIKLHKAYTGCLLTTKDKK